jgi:hypothetical protein
MSERLAKRKAEQDAAAQAIANQVLRFGVTNPPVEEDQGGGGGWWPSWKELGNAGKMGLGVAAGAVNTIAATPIDIADEAVQGIERLVGVTPTDKFDPASIGSYNLLGETYRGIDNAAQYVGQQIAATPGFGKPSSSPFMDTVRSRGWAEAIAEPFVHAVNVGSVAYPVSKMAVGAKLPGTIADAYRQRLLERDIAAQNNLFPAVQRPANVIDVDALQGSRLPARVVDSPATPATRLAEAQTQRALPPAEIAPAIAEPPVSRLTPPAFRERPVPSSSRLTVETIKEPHLGDGTDIIIRSFDQKTGEYTGAITIYYDPISKQARVNGLGATNPMVTPQLIAAAAAEIRKLVGDVQYPLVPSSNLSAYSRPFVERLQQAGLVDPDYQLPAIESINDITKMTGPETFAGPNGANQAVLDPLSYQPTYNDVLRALAESRRQAKLAGETGRLTTSSSQLDTLKFRPPGLNDAAAYRANMRQFDFPEHPLLKQMSDNELDSFMGEIFTNPGSAAQKLIDMWEKIKPSEELGIWADSYANTLENLKKFPDLLKDAYLINEASRIRLMSRLENILLKLPEDEIFS